MSVRIQNNSMNQAKRHDEAKRASSARLASGQQINRASEGAADLAAASKLKSTARATAAALSNANRGLALGQIADGAMSQVQDLSFRLKELAVSAASDTFSDADRVLANTEYQEIINAIDGIADRTRYAGTALLNAVTTFDIQTGEDGSTDTTTFITNDVTSATLGIVGDITSKSNAVAQQTLIDTALDTLATARSKAGSFMVGLESTISVNQVKIENLEGAISVFTEADLAKEATNLAMAEIKSQMAQAMITKENQAASNVTGLVR